MLLSNEVKDGTKSPVFFIFHGNIPSLKNTKGISIRKGRAFMHSSDRVSEWESKNETSFSVFRNKFLKTIETLDRPYNLHLYFIRDQNRKFDYHNACHLILDLLTKYNWIEDDNSSIIVPVFEGHHVSKNQASVIIWTSPRSANNYQQENIEIFLKSVFRT
ncbi:MAG: hypothetical protein EBU90_01710 [Proteobacteria bacterium]|nr:hypothetical protein [Pseudomonadota bacterium]